MNTNSRTVTSKKGEGKSQDFSSALHLEQFCRQIDHVNILWSISKKAPQLHHWIHPARKHNPMVLPLKVGEAGAWDKERARKSGQLKKWGSLEDWEVLELKCYHSITACWKMKESLNTLCQTAALIDFFLSLEQPNCAVVKGVAEATDHALLTNNGWVGQNGN